MALRNFSYEWLAGRSWSMDIVSLVAKIHEHKGKQVFFAQNNAAELERLIDMARIQSTEASNRIEGIITTNTRLKQLLTEKTTPRNRDEYEIMGYRDVLNTIHESYEHIPLRPPYILQLHRDLLRWAGLSYGGKFKNVQNYITETRKGGEIVTRFVPVAPYETPEAVANLCTAYEHAIKSEIVEPLLMIPTFILDFLCIHPFNDGNGRMSRLLTLLLLYQNGYNIGRYISLEKQIEQTKDKYYETLDAAGRDWHEGRNDPTLFIRYMLQIILACYLKLEERLLILPTAKGNSAYDIVKRYVAEKIGKFTSNDVLAHCPSIGRSSALAALKRLAADGEITRYGNGRSTFYMRREK